MTLNRQAQVLIIDDEPKIRELLVDALESEGIDIITAGTGKEALEIAADNPPDIVITDVSLGDCTGMDVLDKLRSTVGEIPAVMISGLQNAGVFSEASR